MTVLFYIIGAIVLGVGCFAIYRFFTVKSQAKNLSKAQSERIKEFAEKLEKGETIDEKEIKRYATDLKTRELAFLHLQNHGKEALFPKELLTIEKGAEANLALWLEFPTELDAVPDFIEHVEKVIIDFDGNKVIYHVFKFKINEPHWAAADGWMLGTVGPFFDDSKPYDRVGSTFSRFDHKFGEIEPKEVAKWVHENISMRS